MAQFFFRFGSMGAGKSIEILKVKHNYEEQDRKTILFTSGIDDRDDIGVVSSRIGLREEAIPIFPESSIIDLFHGAIVPEEGTFPGFPSCILIDEAQFLTKKQVIDFAKIVDEFDIPVMAFGLKNDFQNELFEGSKYLLLHADKMEEIKTICTYCHKKATMNLRLHNGLPVYNGEQVQIGGNESYAPVCRRHYNNPVLKSKGKEDISEEIQSIS